MEEANRRFQKIEEHVIPNMTLAEKNLLNFFRNELKYGEAIVIVKRGFPLFVKTAIKEVKLDI